MKPNSTFGITGTTVGGFFDFWNSLRAASVSGPHLPSVLPALKPIFVEGLLDLAHLHCTQLIRRHLSCRGVLGRSGPLGLELARLGLLAALGAGAYSVEQRPARKAPPWRALR